MGKVVNISPAADQTGLNEEEVVNLQRLHGRNVFYTRQSRGSVSVLVGIVKEPMFILLVASCLFYFILGNISEGCMMFAAILLVTAISLYQELRSSRALEALRQFTAPGTTVIRDGKEQQVDTKDLVPGDIVLLSEGALIPADGFILSASDLTVNESLMTGESLPVEKDARSANNLLFQGTTVNTGSCVMKVLVTGNKTGLGKLGTAIGAPDIPKTLLQRQVNRAVRRLALFGAAGFILICVFNFLKNHDLTGSILLGLTLAMAAIPEEIPVAFSSFMALGAYYMSRKGIISRQPQVIEYLGAVSVVCLDKTGTITENRMKVAMIYHHRSGLLTDIEQGQIPVDSFLLRYAALASEPRPFDSMEVAILQAYLEQHPDQTPLPVMLHEYPLQGRPPMMTHVYPYEGAMMATAKGAPERIMAVCRLNAPLREQLKGYIDNMASRGYRVLGVASAMHSGPLPPEQDLFGWQFEGFIGLYDPPRENAAAVMRGLYDAGISIKLLTGDYPVTAAHIAEKTGLRHPRHIVTGADVMALSESDLLDTVKQVNIFARMFPEAKQKVIEALKTNKEIIAMTGDGVNDGPALKAAHIGIAMGKRGTDIARLAADLVITNDDLEMIPTAITQGRKIYSNLKKAIRYIISIHIPIILTAGLPLILGWKYPFIFTPIHVIFLELIMGPTCSIFFEREPVETGLMNPAARRQERNLLRTDELLITIIQGIMITAGVISIYYGYMQEQSLELTRTVVFITLIISNILLTYVNRSFTANIAQTIRYSNNLAPLVLLVSLLFLVVIQLVPAVRNIFGLTLIGLPDLLLCTGTALISVGWFEIYKVCRSCRLFIPDRSIVGDEERIG
jgi:ATPase, P-type (transporting), HAD superfamily, subfamily IC